MDTHPLTFPLASMAQHLQRSVMRDLIALAGRPEVISFAGGLPAADCLPLEEIETCLDAVLTAGLPKKGCSQAGARASALGGHCLVQEILARLCIVDRPRVRRLVDVRRRYIALAHCPITRQRQCSGYRSWKRRQYRSDRACDRRHQVEVV